jgi:chromate transporter
MDENSVHVPPAYSLRELTGYFFKLGYSGFGGPVALVGYMHRDLVENRKWISEDEYKEGLALAQLAPGPLAAQLCIYLGFVHYRILGATLAGFTFILPSFLMVVSLGIAYKLYGGLPWIQAVFYGIGPAVIGIIMLSSYKLTLKSVSRLNAKSIRENWLLWFFFLSTFFFTILSQSEEILIFIAGGMIYMFVKAPPRWLLHLKSGMSFFLFTGIGIWDYEPERLGKMGLFFLKAGTFVFGSGLAIVPFLHDGVVNENHWLTETQFVDAIAVAMITPGPVVITVGFIGYLIAGLPGAATASIATFLPCYLFTVIPAPYFKKYAKNASIKAFVNGITAAVVGALTGSVIIIATRSLKDVAALLTAIGSLLVLIYVKRIKEPVIILLAAVIGIIIKLII